MTKIYINRPNRPSNNKFTYGYSKARTLIFGTVVVVSALLGTTAANATQTEKILLVGSSLSNGIKDKLKNVLNSYPGNAYNVTVETATANGENLHWHAEDKNGRAYRKIKNAGDGGDPYTIVILQDQRGSQHPEGEGGKNVQYGEDWTATKKLADKAASYGGLTVMHAPFQLLSDYDDWVDDEELEEQVLRYGVNYTDNQLACIDHVSCSTTLERYPSGCTPPGCICDYTCRGYGMFSRTPEVSTTTAPVIGSFAEFHGGTTYPITDLYGSGGGSHASSRGKYLAALTIAAAIGGTVPGGVWKISGMTTHEADYYRAAANAALFGTIDRRISWNVDEHLEEVTIGQSNHDGEDCDSILPPGHVPPVYTAGELYWASCRVGSPAIAGLKFTNVQVPDYATVGLAEILGVNSSDFGIANNVTSYVLMANQPAGAPLDTADWTVLWPAEHGAPSMVTISSDGQTAEVRKIADVSAQIQALINEAPCSQVDCSASGDPQADWEAGDSMSVIVSGADYTQRIATYENPWGYSAPILRISYTD